LFTLDELNVSGHRIGSAELEAALLENHCCAEAAVVGYPHDIKGYVTSHLSFFFRLFCVFGTSSISSSTCGNCKIRISCNAGQILAELQLPQQKKEITKKKKKKKRKESFAIFTCNPACSFCFYAMKFKLGVSRVFKKKA
jgi:hypothetical protein